MYNKSGKYQNHKILEDIYHYQVDYTYRNRYQSTVESVKQTAMTWYQIAGILDFIMTFPLRFNKVSVYSGYTEKKSHYDTMKQIETEDTGIVQSYSCQDRSQHSSPETDP